MLMPKKVKYRKQQRGRMRGKAYRGSTVAFGEYGLQALEPAWITNRQIEAARVAITRSIKRGGKMWIRIFPDKPVTKKPAETRMGKGKGAPEFWVASIRPGRIMFELEGISKITIERKGDRITVGIRTARPGLVIGRKGEQVDKLSAELRALTKKDVQLNIEEVKRADLDAQLVAEHIAKQLEQRVSFRRAMKKALASAMRSGAQGVRIACNGRLGGSEMSRYETYRDGRVPLHTLRADIDFARATAHTAFGTCGVKVWIFNGEVIEAPKTAALGASAN